MAAADFFATVQKIYIAYYGRAADIGGLYYWAGRLDAANGNLNEIINAFGNSAEYTQISAGKTYGQLIDQIYLNLFNRTADAEGKAFYTNLLTTGAKTLASISLDILNGARNNDLTIIQAKQDAAAQFTAALDTPLEVNSYTTSTMGLVKDWLSQITGTNTGEVDASKTVALADINATIREMIGDITPPAKPQITGFTDDSGAAGDFLTKDQTLTLSITAETRSTVEVFLGAQSLGTATETGTAGVFTFTTAALANGVQSFTVKATDAAGNVSVASDAVAVTVDATAPLALLSVSDSAIKVGDVLEVRYLYTGANGRLYQPTILRKRDDKAMQECLTSQLKHVNKEVLDAL